MAKRPPNIRRLTRRQKIDDLIKALGYEDVVHDQDGHVVDRGVVVRRDAVLALSGFDEPRGMEAIVERAFDEPDERVRGSVADALLTVVRRHPDKASLGGDEHGGPSVEQLARTFLMIADEGAIAANRDFLAQVLGDSSPHLLDHVIVDELVRALSDRRSQVVDRAQQMLLSYARDDLEPVLEAVGDPSRAAPAAIVLGYLRDNRALRALVGGLVSPDAGVRQSCVWALGEISDSRAIPALFRATTDAVYEVRKEAFAALDKVGSVGLLGGMASSMFPMAAELVSGQPPAARLPEGQGWPVGDLGPTSFGPDQPEQGGDDAAYVTNLANGDGYAAVENPPPPLPPAETHPVTSADGTSLHVEVFGRDEGRAVVLVHGWGLDHRLWAHQIAQLSPDFKVIVYDLRGHGASAPAGDAGYSYEAFGEDLEAVMEATLGSSRAALLAGHSLGATSIAAWAQHHRPADRTESVALLNVSTGDDVSERLLLRVQAASEPESELARVNDAVIRYVSFCSPTDGQVRFYEEMLAGCPPGVRRACLAAVSDARVREAAYALDVPTLVLAGSQDRLARAADLMPIVDALPNLVELVELPDAGHSTPLEQPEDVSMRLRDLLERVTDAHSA